MNIFTKIGNQIEERKKKRKAFKDKYWKLSASERMDYDNKVIMIKRDSDRNLSLPVTRSITKMTLVFIIFLSILSFSVSVPTNEFVEILRLVIRFFFNFLLFSLLLDLIIMFTEDSKKQLKELNKRFKLK